MAAAAPRPNEGERPRVPPGFSVRADADKKPVD